MAHSHHIYGRHPVSEALRARPNDVRRVYVMSVGQSARLSDIERAATHHGIPVVSASKAALEELVGDVPHQGVVAAVAPFEYVEGSWSFSYILDKEIPYLQKIFQNKFGFTNRFTESTSGFLDWTLETVASAKNDSFYVGSSNLLVQQQIRLLQLQQFNSILAFTIQRDVTNDLFSPSEGTITSAELDEAGLFPLLLQGVFPNLPISQFYRVILTGRWYTEAAAHRYSILAFKLKGGFEDKYGGARSDTSIVIPQTHRFYAGGGNSIRGWNSRDLIAGGSSPYAGQLGGNLDLEGSVELRTNILQSLRDGIFDKIWLVQFIDAGNVWTQMSDFRPNTVAIAAGIGIRYDTFFGPFRIDWGFRIYNPSEPPGQQWITQRQLFGQTFKEAIFHFGIGNAF